MNRTRLFPTGPARSARRPAARLAALAVAALVLVVGCAGPDGASDLGIEIAEPTQEPTAAPTTAAPPVECSNATQSYDPMDLSAATSVDIGRILNRGTLIAGVSADTLLMGARNPFTGEIEGFDVDVLRDISQEIFGDPDRVQFRVITSAQRLEALENGEVDVVARTFSITCARWESIAFSAEYYRAGQKVLVGADSSATSLADLENAGGKRVCAPSSTTTITRLEDYPGVEAVPARTHTACLALFQQGQVDAITGDDTILAGFAAQDPYVKVIGESFSIEPYGIGVAAENVELVRIVNKVLADRVADGRWKASYDEWLSVLGTDGVPPTPVYGRVP